MASFDSAGSAIDGYDGLVRELGSIFDEYVGAQQSQQDAGGRILMSAQSLRRFYAEHQGEQISLKGCQQLCKLAYQKHSRRRSAAGMHQEGWLRKSDRKGRRWRKRWFVLAGDRLVYFKSDKPGATPINVLHLFGAKLRMVEQAQPRGPMLRSRFGFAGGGGGGGGRVRRLFHRKAGTATLLPAFGSASGSPDPASRAGTSHVLQLVSTDDKRSHGGQQRVTNLVCGSAVVCQQWYSALREAIQNAWVTLHPVDYDAAVASITDESEVGRHTMLMTGGTAAAFVNVPAGGLGLSRGSSVRRRSDRTRTMSSTRMMPRPADLAILTLLQREAADLVADRHHRAKKYNGCFVGSEMVDWLVRHSGEGEKYKTQLRSIAGSREAAVAILTRLNVCGYIHHVTDEHVFHDDDFYYVFVDEGQLHPAAETADTSDAANSGDSSASESDIGGGGDSDGNSRADRVREVKSASTSDNESDIRKNKLAVMATAAAEGKAQAGRGSHIKAAENSPPARRMHSFDTAPADLSHAAKVKAEADAKAGANAEAKNRSVRACTDISAGASARGVKHHVAPRSSLVKLKMTMRRISTTAALLTPSGRGLALNRNKTSYSHDGSIPWDLGREKSFSQASMQMSLREHREMNEMMLRDSTESQGHGLTRSAFCALIMDVTLNGAFKPAHSRPYHRRDRPLSHYFIAASHNTYLSGNQLTSPSNIAAIEHALRLGIRVLELDVWDGANGEPEVKHGHTMTSAVPFVDCIQAINRFLESKVTGTENMFADTRAAASLSVDSQFSVEDDALDGSDGNAGGDARNRSPTHERGFDEAHAHLPGANAFYTPSSTTTQPSMGDGGNGQEVKKQRPGLNRQFSNCLTGLIQGNDRAARGITKANQWPLVITIENHCTVSQQRKLVSIMRNVLGERLYRPPGANNASESDSRRVRSALTEAALNDPDALEPDALSQVPLGDLAALPVLPTIDDLGGKVIIRDRPPPGSAALNRAMTGFARYCLSGVREPEADGAEDSAQDSAATESDPNRPARRRTLLPQAPILPSMSPQKAAALRSAAVKEAARLLHDGTIEVAEYEKRVLSGLRQAYRNKDLCTALAEIAPLEMAPSSPVRDDSRNGSDQLYSPIKGTANKVMAPELLQLLCLPNIHFPGFEDGAELPFACSCSFSESTFANYTELRSADRRMSVDRKRSIAATANAQLALIGREFTSSEVRRRHDSDVEVLHARGSSSSGGEHPGQARTAEPGMHPLNLKPSAASMNANDIALQASISAPTPPQRLSECSSASSHSRQASRQASGLAESTDSNGLLLSDLRASGHQRYQQKLDMLRFARRHVIRVFPKGARVDSSNYDPVPCWCSGAQMVALNAQSCDRAVWLMRGKFRDNGGVGWVLKPPRLLRDNAESADASIAESAGDFVASTAAVTDRDSHGAQPPIKRLQVRLIAAHALATVDNAVTDAVRTSDIADTTDSRAIVVSDVSELDLDDAAQVSNARAQRSDTVFGRIRNAMTRRRSIAQTMSIAATIEVAGEHTDSNRFQLSPVPVNSDGGAEWQQPQTTLSVADNETTAADTSTCVFDIAAPDLAILLVVLRPDRENARAPVAQYALPVESLRTGYRTIPLEYTTGTPMAGASLLCHIKCEVMHPSR